VKRIELVRRPPSHRQRLLDFAAELLDDLEDMDLDTIDGEFYWRWCRLDLLEQLEALRRGFPRTLLSDRPSPRDLVHEDNLLAGWLELEGVFDYLRQGLQFVSRFLALEDAASRLYPGVVWRRLVDGERVAMRAAEMEVRLQHSDDDGLPTLGLKVFSGAWTGKQVEAELRRMATYAERWHPIERKELDETVKIRVSFAFADETQARADARSDDPPRFPYVLVEAPLPLPPEKTIEREYDVLVREQRHWHRALPGGENRQEKEVAVRTWTLGLLIRQGETFNHAQAAMHERLQLGDITQTRFGQDRKRLIERVPEARPYLFAADPGSESDTRATAIPTLAKGTDAASALQPLGSETGIYP
jgi:hypothetical protein